MHGVAVYRVSSRRMATIAASTMKAVISMAARRRLGKPVIL
jgi:hypothetical protein